MYVNFYVLFVVVLGFVMSVVAVAKERNPIFWGVGVAVFPPLLVALVWSPASRRTRGILAGLFLATVAAGLLHYRPWGPPPGRVKAWRALEGDAVAVLWSTPSGKSWVGVMERDGSARWHRELPGEALSSRSESPLVAGDLLVVRYGHVDGASVADQAAIAYSLETGEVRWDVVLAPHDRADGSRPWITGPDAAVNGRLFLSVQVAKKHRIASVDQATGAIVAWHDAEFLFYAPRRFERRLVYETINKALATDGSTVRELPIRGHGCRIERHYLVPEDRDTGLALVAYRDADLEQRRVVMRLDRRAVYMTLSACGRYRDHLVLVVEVHEDKRQRTELLVTDRDGRVLRSLDLGTPMLALDWYGRREHPDRSPFSGELPRFVPYVSHGAASELRLVDLERAEIVRTTPYNTLSSDQIFQDGSRWYLTSSNTIVLLDGTIGKLVAAKRYAGTDYAVTPDHLGDGKLWILGRESRWLDRTASAVLDARTLELVDGDLPITDVLAEVRASLGWE